MPPPWAVRRADPADTAGIGAGEALTEDQGRVVVDRAALQAVGIADQDAATDVPVLRARAGQRPDRRPDLVEGGEPLILLPRPILLTLNVPALLPEISELPSWNVLIPVPSTLPLMTEAGARVSVNGPAPGVPVKLWRDRRKWCPR